MLQRGQRFLDQSAAHFFLFLGRDADIAHHLHNAVAENDPIGTDHFGDGERRGDLHRRDAGFFQFYCDRSATARAGASRGGENHRIDAQQFGFDSHLAAHAPRVG
jgi:hypothetical protein